MANLHDLIREFRDQHAMTPEDSARVWRRIVQSTDGAAEKLILLEGIRRPPPRPWLDARRIAEIVAWLGFTAIVVIVALALAGCSFPEEGTGEIACEGCYRPPHDPGHPIDVEPPGAAESSSADDGTEASSDAATSADGTGSESSSSTTWDEGTGNSSTGEAAYEPAHCDMNCPEGDALQPAPEQSEGAFGGCYCASPCEGDDDCAPHEWCDPFFGRCVVACTSGVDCYAVDPSLVCDLWWDDAEHFTHFCSYPNEDAPSP